MLAPQDGGRLTSAVVLNSIEYTRLTLALENLLDRRYRPHGSGVNAPGFNVSLSWDTRF